MDWGTAMIGIVTMALCTLPFVIDYRNRKKREKLLLLSLKNTAQQKNCQISQYESCGDFTLGLDEQKSFVFFIKQKKEGAISQYADLSEFHTCQAAKKTRTLKNKAGNMTVTERVELCLVPKNKSKRETRFELYDEEINKQLSGEVPFVDKWSNQINVRLKNNK